ncbi:MAG: Gfo/Idh/MocA family oxidoreductase [Caldilineales bacterium]|nr:Gfo/Idh/MocA family oxidoreductase [Caldilineales bacterium]MDW8316779.1 Gfo/Idh/MocA family oxidoreductase [Anaerolineae bacterium]
MNKQIRTGVIGVGNMGQHHARVCATIPGSKLVGVADIDRHRAETIAGRYGVEAYTDYRALLDQVDAVCIASPTASHHEIGLASLEHGVHVLIEKPLASTLEAARDLTERARQLGLVLQVGHVERFNPTFVELMNVLSDHHILGLDARRLSPFATRAADVSVVFDLMVHDLDLIMTLVGAPLRSVQAIGGRLRSPQLDHVMAILNFVNGPVASVTASKVTQHKVRQLSVTTADAYVVADFLARTVMIYRQSAADYFAQRGEVLYRQEGLIEQVYVPPVEPLYAEIQHFLACVRDGCTPQVGGEDALRVMAVAERIEAQVIASLTEQPVGTLP